MGTSSSKTGADGQPVEKGPGYYQMAKARIPAARAFGKLLNLTTTLQIMEKMAPPEGVARGGGGGSPLRRRVNET